MKWLDRLAVIIFIFTITILILRWIGLEKSDESVAMARGIYYDQEAEEAHEPQKTDIHKKTIIRGIEKSKAVLNKLAEIQELNYKFNELKELNPDISGWIRVEGTQVDYPIVQAQDNDYYLKHGYDRAKNKSGAIFLDYRNSDDYKDVNSIIYGHNMKNGTFFEGLLKFKDEAFYHENGKIVIETPKGKTYWKVFSAYVTDTDFYYLKTRFESDLEFKEFLEEILEKSQYNYDGKIDHISKILTLSTCTYEFEDARYVIHAMPIGEQAWREDDRQIDFKGN